MRLIVGLGNPGLRYAGTRHNIGFDIVDTFAARHGSRLRRRWCRAVVGTVRIGGEEYLLAKPQTFMNHSGESVREILMRSKLDIRDALVVCDDINLPLGKMRLRARGSAGGHHGLESIMQCTRSSDFARLRIGVGQGRGGAHTVDHVLGRFHKAEKACVRQIAGLAVDCIDTIIAEGIEAAMNRFNGMDIP